MPPSHNLFFKFFLRGKSGFIVRGRGWKGVHPTNADLKTFTSRVYFVLHCRPRRPGSGVSVLGGGSIRWIHVVAAQFVCQTGTNKGTSPPTRFTAERVMTVGAPCGRQVNPVDLFPRDLSDSAGELISSCGDEQTFCTHMLYVWWTIWGFTITRWVYTAPVLFFSVLWSCSLHLK